jgi:hypothetical protein
MLRQHRKLRRGFERRLRKVWGNALDQMYAIVVCAEEAGSEFCKRYGKRAAEGLDFNFDALSGLHARACRTGFEVHRMLASGLGRGAMSRCRTLHELAVVSNFIATCSVEYPDLAERFLLHDHVLNYRDALEYQKSAEALGVEPFSADSMQAMKEGRDSLKERFGSSYLNDNGWAAEAVGKERPGFNDLESLAGMSHLRGYYKWASHEVHADSKGWRLNMTDRAGIAVRSTGFSNDGLADPGSMAITSLLQCTTALLLCCEEQHPFDLVMVSSIALMVNEADDEFLRSHEFLRVKEAQFQAYMGKRTV